MRANNGVSLFIAMEAIGFAYTSHIDVQPNQIIFVVVCLLADFEKTKKTGESRHQLRSWLCFSAYFLQSLLYSLVTSNGLVLELCTLVFLVLIRR